MEKRHEWEVEKSRLQVVSNIIEEQLKLKKELVYKYQSNIVDIKKTMWDEITYGPDDIDEATEIQQYFDRINEEETKHVFYTSQVKKLGKLLYKPYFARVDFQEAGEDVEEMYIGLSTLFDEETKDIIIYDWRAPISSIFYDYELGYAKYEGVDSEIEGNITLKRQFGIENKILKYMFDCSIKIDDEILQKTLSDNASEKMKNIVMSIQKEQNKIIRDDKNNLLVVQGPAGSGKTSIALHRIAYLLYRYRNRDMDSRNIIIFSPNEIFNDYISNVLPELGEDNMQQTTFYEFANEAISYEYVLENMTEHMEYLLTGYNDPSYEVKTNSVKFKLSSGFLEVVKKYLQYVEEQMIKFHSIEYLGNVIITKEELEELFYGNYKRWPVVKRLEKIRERIWYLIRPLQKKRLVEIEEKMKFEVNFEHEIKPFSRLKRFKELKPIIEDVNSMTSLDIISLYKILFQNKSILSKISQGLELPENMDIISEMTLSNIENKFISYEDIYSILYMMVKLEGSKDLSYIKHVVIDESQDYTIFQYEIFKSLFRNSNMTILGDFNQSIHPFTNPVNNEGISDVFRAPISAMMNLTKSYRSTKDIFDFCQAILSTRNSEIQPVNRSGNKPIMIKSSNDKDMIEKIKRDIKALEEGGAKSIAVICKTAKESSYVHDNLKEDIRVGAIINDKTKYKGGKIVIPSYLAKGLEFDAVLVYDASKDNYFNGNERGLFYTVCTRALHNLYIYFKDNMSPFLEGVNENLYEKQ